MLGQTLDQRYKVVSKLGMGGLATVFLGRDLKLGRPVALKVLRPDRTDPTALQRLRAEVEMQAKLDHPHIVRLYDMGCGSTPYLVMEFISGADFGAMLAQATLAERLFALVQVTHGLEALHALKIIHRDLKPSNVLVARDGQVKLADFGLCRWLNHDAGMTREGTTVGTARYMAPEQACGLPVDERSDLYSLGIILYECCTGRTPFTGSAVEVIGQHVHAQPARPRTLAPTLAPELERLILQLLAKDPDQRPVSASVVRAELERLLRSQFPSMTDAELRQSLGTKANSASRVVARAKEESSITPRAVGSSKKLPVIATSTPVSVANSDDDLPKLKYSSDSSRPLVGIAITPRKTSVGSDSALTAVARKTPAPLTKSAGTATKTRSTRTATQPKQKAHETSAVVTAEHPTFDTDSFDELADAEAYAPIRRRRSKPKRVLPKWLTPSLIVRMVLGSVALGIIWGSAGHVSGMIAEIRKSFTDANNSTPVSSSTAPVLQVPQPDSPQPVNEPSLITVQTQIKGATVLVDGEVHGTTPLEKPLELKPGQHRLEVAFGKSKLHETIQVTAGQTRSWPTKDFSPGQVAETCKRSVCLLRTPDGHGSGFLVQDQHTIVTAAHVIDDVRSLDDLEFIFSPSADKRYPSEDELKLRGAKLIHFDRQVDVAILRLNDAVPTDRQPLVISESKVELQTNVIAVGNPGYGKGRYLPLDTSAGLVTNNNPLMTNAEVKGGYSGGPVFGARTGEVVGITSAKLVCSGVARGDSFTRAFLSHIFLVRNALQAWNALTPEEQNAHADKVQQEFAQQVSDRRVFQAGLYLAVTSDFYFLISTKSAEVYGDYFKRFGKVGGKAVNDSLEDLRRAIRKNFNPDLEELTDRYLKAVLKDELINAETRAKLEKTHSEFVSLQKDATKLEGHYEVFQKRVQKTKDNIDATLKPLLKDLAEKLAVEDYKYPRMGN